MSGDAGWEKLRTGLLRMLLGEARGEANGAEGLTLATTKLISSSPADSASRRFLDRRRRRAATSTSDRAYDPTMQPIWAGRKAGSRRAPAERGGPSSGAGAGSQSMPSGLFCRSSTTDGKARAQKAKGDRRRREGKTRREGRELEWRVRPC